MATKETRTTAQLDQRDLENALLDERHQGYGYRSTDRMRRTEALALDTLVVAHANNLGLDYEDLLAWTNSKSARWLGEELLGGQAPDAQLVARYLTRATVAEAKAA